MKKKRLFAIFATFALLSNGASAGAYTVKKGDTFWTISQAYGVSLSAILAANNADESTVLNIGDTIVIPSSSAGTYYTVKKGDTFWTISQACGVSLSAILAANNADETTVLNIGDTIVIPSSSAGTYYTVKKGDTFWTISQAYGVSLSAILAANNADETTVLNIGDTIVIPSSSAAGAASSGAYITYTTYTVKSGDTYWSIAIDCGIPMSELLEANSLTESSAIKVGQVLTVPVHNVPVKETVSSKYGELLDWWTEAQYVIPINAVFTVQDLATGKSFTAKRTIGSNHADCEPLTAEDTAVMKEIWGGSWSWDKRPVLIIHNGRKIAASAAGMPHAGNEWADGGVWTDWRSDDYGAGINYDYIKGNDFSGHFDIHFYNSTTHSGGTTSAAHQANVLAAAGMA